jgi:peptidyl-prolyl cis-trans isomerase A (cyclophilin A)
MKRTLILCMVSCLMLSGPVRAQAPDPSVLKLKAPDRFKAEFTTTKGSFTIEVYRDWSPLGADRLYQLLKSGFYDSNCLFRVQKGYVVQFGIGDHKEINYFWDKLPIKDEPMRTKNLQWTVSYARDTANSRTTQLFINLKDNYKLDTVLYNGVRGFPPVAKVISGFETVEQFNGQYGFEPANHQDSVMVQGNTYWRRKFAGLDYIVTARILE